MASANVELVRSINAPWERGDFSSAEWADPQIEFVIAYGPAPGSWTGRLGLAEGFRSFVNAWEDYRVEAEEYRELDHERVLVFLHPVGRGRASGLDLRRTGTTAANLFHIRGGKVTRLVMYLERDRALADLGLAPKARSSHS
jgi:ketosteroid isomerase-like protein